MTKISINYYLKSLNQKIKKYLKMKKFDNNNYNINLKESHHKNKIYKYLFIYNLTMFNFSIRQPNRIILYIPKPYNNNAL